MRAHGERFVTLSESLGGSDHRRLLTNSPGRDISPGPEISGHLLVRHARVAGPTSVGHTMSFSLHWRDKPERMAANIDVGDRSRDLRHVAVHTQRVLASVVTVCDIVSTRTGWRLRSVASFTHGVQGLYQIGPVLGSVHVVTIPATNRAAGIL